jgi:uncharacterized protein YndB with AHSA1/START domain/DNA-binding transcriptional ArsR family regulator
MSVLDRRFAALADPTRRQILDRVAAGPVSVSVLAEPLHMTLPGVLKHVRVLEAAQLVVTAKVGRNRMCVLGPQPLDDVAEWVSWRRRHWSTLLDRFAGHLAGACGACGARAVTGYEIRQQRLVDAPPDIAFQEWVGADARMRWHRPEPHWMVEADTDLRVGGAWRVAFGPSRAQMFVEEGVFDVVEPSHRVVYMCRHHQDGRADLRDAGDRHVRGMGRADAGHAGRNGLS